MSINPLAGPDRHVGEYHPSVIARSSVWLGAVALAAFAAVYAFIVIAFLVGGDEAISDNWVGWMGAYTLYGAALGSFVALGLGLFARMKHETWRAVWLGIAAFPTIVAIVLLSEFTFLE